MKRRKKQARGAGRRDEDVGMRVEGAGNIQVGGASHRDRRWGAGEKLEGFDNEKLRMGRQ